MGYRFITHFHQDWPATKNLADLAPELHTEVEKTIPVPDLVRNDGVFNVLGMVPKTACPGDPGESL